MISLHTPYAHIGDYEAKTKEDAIREFMKESGIECLAEINLHPKDIEAYEINVSR
jgi:hypothetical protein